MLCPECRRQVEKTGYCPQGHLARPDWAEKLERVAQRASGTFVPAGPPPVPAPMGAAPTPGGSPGLPPDAGPIPPPRKGRRVALVLTPAIMLASLLGYVFIGRAGASNLRIKFTSGETHRYRIEMTMRGKGGNLQGGFSADVSVGADLTQRTGSVDEDGAATLTYILTNFTYSENSRRVTPPPGAGASFTVKMRPDGTVSELESGNSFGLDDVNPAGDFLNPANAGPLLPGRKVDPGDSWQVKVRQELPDLGTLSLVAENTLLERRKIAGNDAVTIRSKIHVPLDLRIGRDALVKEAKAQGQNGDAIPRGVSISMLGNMDLTMTQTIYTTNGLLQSGLGDGRMRGTMSVEGIKGVGPLSIVFDLQFNVTMIKLSTGDSA